NSPSASCSSVQTLRALKLRVLTPKICSGNTTLNWKTVSSCSCWRVKSLKPSVLIFNSRPMLSPVDRSNSTISRNIFLREKRRPSRASCSADIECSEISRTTITRPEKGSPGRFSELAETDTDLTSPLACTYRGSVLRQDLPDPHDATIGDSSNGQRKA